ncbi:hypothetical protein [Zobellia galactanivorans]|uniref:hypothetical protein n=1 Tax=Zobellia galactanivorans (strain DSM 12802 / CCUG 47099 / CIP 106680 / NCIMB 13871 / Dsij) TaxID=63186 RepID=UPI001C07099D|nr:hypothetical protein [Zobellia galactanivorans]MBU3028248.1 hypothetical protein [Zobellia galactanivorans]
MRSLVLFAFLGLIVGCSSDLENQDVTLSDALKQDAPVLDNVIACAASNENDHMVSVFFYPRDGASNVRYYETENIKVSKDDFGQYYRIDNPVFDVFNGYLKKFEVVVTEEKWAIVSFEEGGKIHLSNPIRIKHHTKPTEYTEQSIVVDSADTGSPLFHWTDGKYTDSRIYFGVVSDSDDNFISGTYTHEHRFQYYDLENVVVNITKGTPPTLKADNTYSFTLMAVSEDNWVNLFSEIEF